LTPEENEEIVQFALDEFPMEIEAVDLPGLKTWPGLTGFQDKRFHPDMEKTIRLYPFDRVTEGFYVARLRKLESLDKSPHPSKQMAPRHHNFLSHRISPVKKSMDYLMQHFGIPEKALKRLRFLIHGEKISFCTRDFEQFPIYGRPMQIGTNMARTLDRVVKLNSGGTHLLGPYAKRSVVELPDLESLQKYVNREELDLDLAHPGQHIIRYKGMTMGYGILDKGKFKSQFPKGEWPFELVNVG
ncbi:MAG TPA: hypothetical protein PKV71_02200, partial [Calditrichia bacterium]|nr:hypothetical protein [Calditrichia bacterium]